jgi:CHAT domain-containing protein
LPRLPGTAREVAAIAAIAERDAPGSAQVALGAAATREAVVAVAGERVDVLHLATHATLDAEIPALAALVLSRRAADGRERAGDLRPAEIAAWPAAPPLVVLSACDAAAEPSRSAAGLMNLTRAFLVAGTRYVVASRWAVGDAGAVALMTEFYRALLDDGLAPDAALTRAQQSLAAQPRWRAPFHWAGFVVTGAAP